MSNKENNKENIKLVPKLGRGLEALFSQSSGKKVLGAGRTIIELPLKRIRPNDYQPRQHFSKEAVDQLAHSIKENGLIQPIVVRPTSDNCYELIAGERRYKACLVAGYVSVPAIVKTVSNRESLQMALVENLDREDLNAIEIAEGYQRLVEEFNYTHQDLADIFNKSRSAVTNTLRLIQLNKKVRNAVLNENISEGHARALLSLDDEGAQSILLDRIINQSLSVRDTEAAVDALKGKTMSLFGNENESVCCQSPYSFKFQDYFASKNIKIKYKEKGQKGTITFSYKNEEELSHLAQVLGISV